MRCINKAMLFQQLNACPSDEISENRMHFWLTMFGHDVVYPESENEENSASKEEILEQNDETEPNESKGENINEETNCKD